LCDGLECVERICAGVGECGGLSRLTSSFRPTGKYAAISLSHKTAKKVLTRISSRDGFTPYKKSSGDH
jgi:hypothetical protein